MNCWNIHPIPQIWFPLTSVSSQNSNSALLVSIFSSNQETIAVVEGYIADLNKNHYKDKIMAVEHCWNKCTSFKGDNVVNKNNFEIINLFLH
jgi:uncharacterized protein YifN (PemK superfamily)